MSQIVYVPNVGNVSFPDGMTQDEMANVIKQHVSQGEQNKQNVSSDINQKLNQRLQNVDKRQYPEFNSRPIIPGVRTGEDPGAFMSLVKGINNGAQQVTQGVLQPLLESNWFNEATGYPWKEKSKQYAQNRETDTQNAASYHPSITNFGDFFGNAGAALPIVAGFEGFGPAKFIKQNPNASNFIQGSLYGGAQYVPEGGSRPMNAIAGGLLNTAIPYAVNKATNSFLGNYESPNAQKLMDLSKKWDVPVFASDISNTPRLNALAQILEEIPGIGIRGKRKEQMNKAMAAGNTLEQKYSDIMESTPYKMSALENITNMAGDKTSKYFKSSNNLLDEIGRTGPDINQAIKNSTNVNLLDKKIIAGTKYDAVDNLASEYGAVNLTPVIKTIDTQLGKLNQSAIKDDATINFLTKLRKNLSENQYGYAGTKDTLSALKTSIDSSYQGKNSLIGKEGVQYLQPVANEISNSMEKFLTTTNPRLTSLYSDANKYYRNNVAPFKNAQLARAMNKEADPEKAYDTFIKNSGDRQTGPPNRLYNALEEKGKSAVKYGMITDAMKIAYDPEKNIFSPAIMSSALSRKQASLNVFFRGQDKAEVDGFINLMKHVERAPVALSKPETGVKNLPAILGLTAAAGAIFAPTAAVGGISLVLLSRALLTTNAGKRLLLASSKLPPGSTSLHKLYEQFLGGLSRGAIGSAAEIQK